MTITNDRQTKPNDERMLHLGQTAIDVAHDLKNLLFAITAYADMALAQTIYDSRMSRDLNCLLSVTERASLTVDQILQYASPQKLPFRLFNVIPIINEVMEMVDMTTPSTIRVHSEYHCNQDVILGNSTQFYQCIMNLAYNAVHAMHEKGDLTIRVERCNMLCDATGILGDILEGEYLAVDIIDTGQGIDPDLVEKIFDPFFSTKKSDRGHGLGLAILRNIVQSHHGNIQVFSTPLNGTRFRLLFPKVT